MNNALILDQLQKRLGSADWSKWQIHRWSFWDYIRYPTAGTNQLTFFSVPLGGVDANSSLAKTMEQTNVPKARSFGQVYFFIQQIRTHLHILPKGRQNATLSADADLLSTTMTDMMAAMLNLARQGVLNIKIGQKDYFDIPTPFLNCPPCFGVNIDQHFANRVGTGQPAQSLWLQQGNWLDDAYAITPPQMIEPEQVIESTIDFANANSPALTGLVDSTDPRLDVGLILDGYVARPAQ